MSLNMFIQLLLFLCFHILSATQTHIRVSDLGLVKKVIFDLNEAKKIFDEFIVTFKKHYDNPAEYEHRLKMFTENLEDVNNRNKNASSEIYGITQFLDMNIEEFIRDYTGLNFDSNSNDILEDEDDPKPLNMKYRQVPGDWDWRKHGVVTPVKDQGACHSCWSFSAVGCVESQYAIKYKQLVTLSEQQLVDCFRKGGGCRTGSLPHRGSVAAAKMGGFMSQADYPYKGYQYQCRFDRRKVAVKLRNGTKRRDIRTEEQLKQLVYEYGPVSVGIAAFKGFYEYKAGISSVERLECEHHHINHAVLIVGYGTDNGVPYWIIKNSFGREWGEQGYMRMVRGKNACSILEYVATAYIA